MNIALVEFDNVGDLYPFQYNNMDLKVKDLVVAEHERGISIGKVMRIESSKTVDEDLKHIIRKATEKDIETDKKNQSFADEAFIKCKEEIRYFALNMKLVKVKCMLDRSKIIFYFVSPGRVDFRALVKRLASLFKTRIEMRQIGVRDEARLIGGLGLCGDELCCSRFLRTFNPVSVKMAKDQNLNINVKKISGACGRLMCCLYYEQNTYNDFMSSAPPMDSIVAVGDVEGKVVYINPIKKTLIIRNKDRMMVEVNVSDITKIIKKGVENGR